MNYGLRGAYLNDTGDHVADVGASGTDASNVLVETEPHVDLDSVVVGEGHIDGEVVELTVKGTTGTSDGDLSVGNRDGD